jgi:hypothetical protein
MKWIKSLTNKEDYRKEWHTWFAWFPITIQTIVIPQGEIYIKCWLECVE